MKQSIILIIAIIFFNIDLKSQQLSQQDKLAEKILVVFKSKDFSSYKKLLIDTTDYREYINVLVESNQIPKTIQEDFQNNLKYFKDSGEINFKGDFIKLLQDGEELGIDWKKIERKGYFIKKSDDAIAIAYLDIKCNDSSFVIFGIELVKLSTGYKINGIQSILKGSMHEYLNPAYQTE